MRAKSVQIAIVNIAVCTFLGYLCYLLIKQWALLNPNTYYTSVIAVGFLVIPFWSFVISYHAVQFMRGIKKGIDESHPKSGKAESTN